MSGGPGEHARPGRPADDLGEAGALLHSLVGNHALLDGNKRLGWHAAVGFVWINGGDILAAEDEAFDLVVAVAAAEVNSVVVSADRCGSGARRVN